MINILSYPGGRKGGPEEAEQGSSRGDPLNFGRSWRSLKIFMELTDMIFVNFFTPAHFYNFENLPQKTRKSRHYNS